jgi:hypothetical protein
MPIFVENQEDSGHIEIEYPAPDGYIIHCCTVNSHGFAVLALVDVYAPSNVVLDIWIVYWNIADADAISETRLNGRVLYRAECGR